MITLHTNLKAGAATTQHTGYDFDSYCRFGDHLLACRGDALCSIGGSSGTEEAADSFVETFITKLGYDGNKRLRFIYLYVETDGELRVTPYLDDVAQTAVVFNPTAAGKQLLKMPCSRNAEGTYLKFKIENVDGCWFAIDKAMVLPINLPLCR